MRWSDWIINHMLNKFHLLIKEEDILSRIKDMSKEITNKLSLSTDRIIILGIMDGCFPFLYNLIKDIPLKLEVKTIKINTYDGMIQNKKCKIDMGGDEFSSINGARVIVIDDILDSGKTLKSILATIARLSPSSIETVVLLDKNKSDITANYVGFKVEDRWTIGFGMDLNGFYRNLKDIYYMG